MSIQAILDELTEYIRKETGRDDFVVELDSRPLLSPEKSDLTCEHEDLIRRLVEDYDRRMSTRWGRFLLWLLRKTT